MKLVATLLGFYMLLLSCMPCGDSKDCSSPEPVSIAAGDAGHQDHSDKENCTPFCVCACCAVPVFQLPVTSAQLPLIPTIQMNGYHDVRFISAAHYRIWQPPKATSPMPLFI